nr:PREDICTED: major histocompatibility complex class I-related gene protein-like [Latimeria chalumnae]|eukprot:XP_014350855.1 PREDICTED: major histocompatibility complex class I-related gene protein-like [Latimeria chalumnae]
MDYASFFQNIKLLSLEPISEAEVKQSIKSMSSGKANGLDGFGVEFFKVFQKVLVPAMVGVFWEAHATGLHSLLHFYSGTEGLPGFPKFMAVGYVDGVQIEYYDSWSEKVVPRQHWMEEYSQAEDPGYWEGRTQRLQQWRQTFKTRIHNYMQLYNQTSDNEEETWCTKNFLSFPALKLADVIRSDLLEVVQRIELPVSPPAFGTDENILNVKRALISGYFLKYNYDFWGEVVHLAELVPEDKCEDVCCLTADGIEVSRALMKGAIDNCDTAARGVAKGVTIWRQGDATIDGVMKYGYDGEDFISFDKEKLMWVAAVDQAIPTRNQWNADTAYIQALKAYFEGQCNELLSKFIHYGNKTLEQKVRPEVTVYDKPGSESKSVSLTCMATGFHPRAVDVSWVRDGNTQMSNAYTAGILPNEDGTFQIKRTLQIDSEDKRSYACHVDHSSLEEIMKVPWVPSNGLATWIIIVIVIVVVVVAVLVAAVVGFLIWRRKKRARLEQISSDSSSETSSTASSDISTSKL